MSAIEFPIRPPGRPPGYLARQGYVKPLWQIMLRRSDVEPHTKYLPDDEAYNLPALTEKLESDKYSVSTIDHVTVELTRTDELVDFLKGLKEPKYLRVKIFSYLLFRKWQKQLVWFGLLQNLPEGIDAYPWDKLKLTFMSPPGAWENTDDVKDPDTGSPYHNKHVADVLLPAFLREACGKGKGGTYEWKLEEPKVRSDDYFWSGTDVPRKRLAEATRMYDDTYRVKSLCWDSKRKRLYMGVRGHPNEMCRDPWLMSYEPAKRKWRKVTRFYYGGNKLPRNTRWEVLHLEYDAVADKVRFICQTAEQDLTKAIAHKKCYGAIDMASPPRPVTLSDNNLFTLHNKGFTIRSVRREYRNAWPLWKENTKYYASASAECIGWGTPRGIKEPGVLDLGGKVNLSLSHTVEKNKYRLPVYQPESKSNNPRPGCYVEVCDAASNHKQRLGYVKKVEGRGSISIITVEIPTDRRFKHGSLVTMYKLGWYPPPNVFIGRPQNVKVEYIYPGSASPAEPSTVYVEARYEKFGRQDFFWPREIGQVDEEGEYYIDRIGYTSFISIRELETLKPKPDEVRYHAFPVTPYKLTFEGYNATFLLGDGFLVSNAPQMGKDEYPLTQPGPCQLRRYGKVCKVINEKDIETYGDIFLFKEGSDIYAAWNDHGWDAESGEYYATCKIAKWVGDNKFRKWHLDRWPGNWKTKPECYLTSFVRYSERFYGGRRYYEPNWTHTNMRIFWAKEPGEDERPTDYESYRAAIAYVVGDQTDLLNAGAVIRLSCDGTTAGTKLYFVSEAYSELRQTEYNEDTKDRFAGNWRVITDVEGADVFVGQVTILALLSVDQYGPGTNAYQDQIRKELFDPEYPHNGRYIWIKKGRDERHQIWAHEGKWLPKYAAKPTAGDPAEGKEAEHEAKQWQGEGHTVEYDGDYVRMPRVKLKEKNVVGGSITVTLKDSGRALDLIDKTDFVTATFYLDLPFPAKNTCCVHRRQGDDNNECHLYFNPALDGEEIDVVYEYYAADAYIRYPVIFEGKLYFNESGDRHLFLRVSRGGDATKVKSTYSPRVGDRELTCITAADDRLWAISAPSNLLVQYAKEWAGYVHEVDGKGKKIWNIVADLARASDQYCFDHLGELYVVNRATPTRTGTFPHILKITRKDLPPYEKVTFSYANGKVERGCGKPELSLRCNYVYDKGHAEILCDKAYEYYTVRRREYAVECAGVLEQIGLCEEKTFDYQGKPASGIIVGRQFNAKGTTTFTVVEKAAQAEGGGAGGGGAQEG